jgi:hypothetical protein
MHWLPLAIALTYRALSLVGIVAILDWTSAHDLVRGAAVMGALWAMALTTDLQRGRQ